MEQTAKKTVAQLREDIGELRARISRNGYTVEEVEAAEAQKRLEEAVKEYELRTMRGEE